MGTRHVQSPRTRMLVLGVIAIVAILLVVGGLVAVQVLGTPAIEYRGTDVVISNPGLPMRRATVNIGGPSVSRDVLPRGVTRIALEEFAPGAVAPAPAVGASVTGSRLGFSWTYYFPSTSVASVRDRDAP